MENAPTRTVFGEITDFLATDPTPDEIIVYRLPNDLRERAEQLLQKNNAGTLSEDEHEEMMDFVRVDQMMALLKVKIRVNRMDANE